MKKNKKLVIFLVIAVIAIIVLTGILIARKMNKNGEEEVQQQATVSTNGKNVITMTFDDAGDAIIKADQIRVNDVTYVKYKEDSKVELIATKTEAGEIKIAFNISQVDFENPKGYFVKDGNQIKCLACDGKLELDQIGVEGGECRPISIYSEAITKTDDGIKINGSTLEVNENLFAKIEKH